jgi:MED6 mediator sub complex component
LKTMSGLEYIVAQEPAEMAPGTGTGVWVIRKQTRRKRPGQEDEVTVHSTYFVMGENIYMAPAVGDVIGSRLVGLSCMPPRLTMLTITAINIPLPQQIYIHRILAPKFHPRPRPHLHAASPSFPFQSLRIPTPPSKQRKHTHA